MIQLIALVLIIAGIYFIIRGFTDSDSQEAYVFNDKFEGEREYREEGEHDEEFKRRKRVKGGGVILIGPIPIVFGESRYAIVALILAIVLMVISFVFMFGGKL
ncbi:MAG: TIGR00304 family membrane protein [Halobacteriota archaeon]